MASDKPPPDRVETIATRPLETPAKEDLSVPPPRRPRAIWIGAAVAAVIAVTFVVVRAGTATTPTPAPNAPSPSPSPPPNPNPSPPAIPTPTPTLPPTPAPIPTLTPSPSPSASVQAPAAKAHLALFGDPGTLVALDGTPRGSVPVRDLALEPGPHDVLFTFEPTGERRGDRITLQPGEKVRLRADFAGAVPTIRIER
jgi:hypothetical protein